MGVLDGLDVVQNLLGAGRANQHGGDFLMAQQPGQRHLGQRLAAGGGKLVQRLNLGNALRRDVLLLQEAAIGVHAAVGGDAVQIPVGQQALRQRAVGDNALVQPRRCILQAVALNRAVKDGVAVLVDDERHLQLVQNRGGLLQRRAVIVGQAHIQRLAAAHGLRQRAHRLLQRGVGVHAVMVENVHIVQPHAAQALIQAGQQILAAAPVAVGACPHFITSLGRDNQLVAVDAQIVPQDFAKVFLGGAGLRAVVIGQVKVGDAVVERGAAERTHILVGGGIAKIVPQP